MTVIVTTDIQPARALVLSVIDPEMAGSLIIRWAQDKKLGCIARDPDDKGIVVCQFENFCFEIHLVPPPKLCPNCQAPLKTSEGEGGKYPNCGHVL
jgi:hypothetical protein